jgi:hypothetical protein
MKAEESQNMEWRILKALFINPVFKEKYNYDPITLQEWEAYRADKMEKATDKEKMKLELDDKERKIRENGGFMELIITDQNGGRVNIL